MAKKLQQSKKSKSRTVIEPLTQFDPSQTSSLTSATFTCIATTSLSGSELVVYIGTDLGTLLLLTLNPNFDSPTVKLLRYATISHSPVDSIHVVVEIGKVLVVSDGYLYLVDLRLLQSVKRLSGFRGVTAIARHISSSGNVLSGFRSGGVGGGDGSSCVFAVATAKKVVVFELGSGGSNGNVDGLVVVLKEMVGVDGVKTMCWVDDSIIFGGVSGYGLISCVTGHVTVLFSLPDMAATPPCLKLLLKGRNVILLVDNVGIIVDAHGQPVGGSLVFHRAPDSMAELSLYAVVVGDGKLELYHKRSGVCVQALSFGGFGSGRCLVADEEDGHGSYVVVASSSKVFCYKRIPPEEQIKDLLRNKNFKEAISLSEELEAEGDVSSEILSFVHAQVGFLLLFDLHFEEAVDHFLQSETMQPLEIFPFIMRDPNRWSLLVPRIRYWGLHPPPTHIEAVVEDGFLAIQRAIFLKKAGVESNIDDRFLSNPPSRSDLLDLAFRNIIRYLQVTRNKDHSPQVKEGVDTLLMYLYRTLNYTDDMEKLASSENSCVVEELETLLEESGHMRTLAFLYANKGMSSKALAIWRVLARSYSSVLNQENADMYDLEDMSLPTSSKESAAVEACKILEESVEQELILQHLGWISEISEELAIRVLTSDKRIKSLLPDAVIAAIDPKKVEILQRYLQWLIENQDCTDAQLHTLYAISLARSALGTLEQENSYDRSVHFPSHNPIRERLQIFLHSSDLYDVVEVLGLIEDSDLLLEKAILYRKLGQETLVLQILALKLEDSEAAEQYCSELGRPDAYMQLLDMYLNPQNGKELMFKAAVHLLHNHGESLDPIRVLERLSPDMPLQLASETVLRMLRARHHHLHQGKILHSLSRAVNDDGRLTRLEERVRHVQINDESLCDSCHARLGTKLFAMYPDDSIVCYKCFRRQGESTSVTGCDFKEDILVKPGWLVSR